VRAGIWILRASRYAVLWVFRYRRIFTPEPEELWRLFRCFDNGGLLAASRVFHDATCRCQDNLAKSLNLRSRTSANRSLAIDECTLERIHERDACSTLQSQIAKRGEFARGAKLAHFIARQKSAKAWLCKRLNRQPSESV